MAKQINTLSNLKVKWFLGNTKVPWKGKGMQRSAKATDETQ